MLAPLVTALASILSACAGGPSLPQLPTVGSLGTLPKIEMPAVTIEPSLILVGSTEVYTRIARGAMTCWFGPQGRLTATHIFHADAAPTLNGGGVEIVVHERAVDQPKPWGYKAFRVQLSETTGMDGSPGGGGTRITVDNVRMSDTEAPVMRAEVYQWASGTDGCKVSTPSVVATAPAASAPPPAAKAGKAPAKQARPAAAQSAKTAAPADASKSNPSTDKTPTKAAEKASSTAPADGQTPAPPTPAPN